MTEEQYFTEMNGSVAIRYFQTTPHSVVVHGNAYVFVVKANICLCWVKKEDVEALQKVFRKTCCGGNNALRSPEYRLANVDDVRRWTVGGGR